MPLRGALNDEKPATETWGQENTQTAALPIFLSVIFLFSFLFSVSNRTRTLKDLRRYSRGRFSVWLASGDFGESSVAWPRGG